MTEPGFASASAASSTPGDRGADSPEDLLYEQYLDAALAGALESPEAFCARHGVASVALRERLAALHKLIDARRAPSGRPGVPLAAEPGLPWPRLGEFRLLKRLSEGGMGVLYLAEQESLGRRVALKVIRPELAGSASAAERFRREAKAVARLRHPHIVAVHAFGEENGVLWCAMELVPGRSLAELLDEARAAGVPPKVADVLRWIESIARALEAAHEQGILHRDVKPSNIRVAPDGRALLVDFGLARDLGSDAPTLTHDFAGSPAYASPEQVENRHGSLDGRTDVYSLGVTLHECLTLVQPFAADSVERVFHRILSEDPPRVGRLRPDVPRDLEVVTQRAIEKDAARRYASARHLADDLLAVLELRPIHARAPGVFELLRRWVRAHRPAAAAAAALVLALAAFAGFLLVQEWRRVRQREGDASARVHEAQALLAGWIGERQRLGDLAAQIARLESDVATNFVEPERAALLDRKGELDRMERERDLLTPRIEQLLIEAERLDAGRGDVERIRADLYLEQWRDAASVYDRNRMQFFAGLVRAHDRDGRHAREIRMTSDVSIESDPPGASVHLFALRLQSELVAGGEQRLVPVPLDDPKPAVAPGAIVLRVTRGAGGLRENDLIVELAGRPIAGSVFVTKGSGSRLPFDLLVRVDDHEIHEVHDVEGALDAAGSHRFEFLSLDDARETVAADDLATLDLEIGDAAAAAQLGGAPARVFQDGRLFEVELAAGLRVRATAAPLAVSPACLAGTTPLRDLALSWEPGIALLRLAGYEDARVVLFPPNGWNSRAKVALLPAGTSPPDTAYVALPFHGSPFWLMDREVTCSEYLEFLNDPPTQRRIGTIRPIPLVPRASADAAAGGSWPRDPDGTFRLGPGFEPDWPVMGVSWNDAQEFAAWRNRTTDVESRGLRFGLPTLEEWRLASHGHPSLYIYGEEFRPHWFKSCYSRPAPNPEAVLRFPIDESAWGVFDLTGGVSEWCDSWYDDPRKGQRAIAGGNWAIGDPTDFRAESAFGLNPALSNGAIGMRLVCRRIEGGR